MTSWIIVHQAPLSMEFSRQEYWSGMPFPPPGDLPNAGTEPLPLKSPALAGRLFTSRTNWATIYITATAKSLQSCPTLCDPIDGSPLGSPVPGILRQEHWSGLPFPSPMHESENWKCSCSVVSNPQWPHGLQPSRLLHPWDFPGNSTGAGCHCLLWFIKIGDLNS